MSASEGASIPTMASRQVNTDSQVIESTIEEQPQSDPITSPHQFEPGSLPATSQQVDTMDANPTSTSTATGTVFTEMRTRTRTIRPPKRYTQEMAFIAQSWDDIWDIQDFEIQEQMDDPIAFAATTNPDTMYLHEALRAPDRNEFIEAMKKEVKAHEDLKHWELIPKSQVPQGTLILPAVWSMKRKRRINTHEVYKWKARLNVHGGKQIKDVHYWETYSPVVKWSSIRMFLTLAVINKWHTRQVDFVLAYPQADIETDLYMEIPRGFEFAGTRQTHCLQLKKNLYGQKQAGRVWNKHLHKGLVKLGFKQSNVDECVYYRNSTILLCYVDDTILIDPDDTEINKVIQQLKDLQFNVTDEGQIEDYLGVRIQRLDNGQIQMSQPHLIQQILEDLNLEQSAHSQGSSRYTAKTQSIPAPSTVILQRDVEGESHKEKWSYRSVIGKLNYLEKSTRPDLAYAVHNAARFSSDPKTSHSQAVKRIGRYLLGTKDKGIIMTPDPSRSIEVFADADF
jgi:histone deacetylase 1/2